MKQHFFHVIRSIVCTTAFLLLPLLFYAQSTVTIGNLTWTVENLNVEKFRNGDPIMQVRSFDEMKQAWEEKKPAWCYLDFDPVNGIKYGRLYNWYAINDPRGLAPAGWRIPTTEEWYLMCEQLGGEAIAGKKMKTSYGWANFYAPPSDVSEATNKSAEAAKGTNESGLSVLPSESMPASMPSGAKMANAYFWSSTEANKEEAFCLELRHTLKSAYRTKMPKWLMFAVRCIK
jgi:uncharacterized protein (TIGR02145 family)